MSKTLLIETITFVPQPVKLTEGLKSKSGNMIVEGILATPEVKNGNGRYYSKDLWDREIKKYRNLIKDRRACGELDHPETQVINLKNVSHNIIDIWWDGGNVMGKLEILPTPSGNIVKELFKCGGTVGISSRALGSVRQLDENTVEVQDDLELICWDIVSTPSTHGAFVTPINEGVSRLPQGKYQKVNGILRDIICLNTNVCSL